MAKSMTKSQIIAHLAAKTKTTKKVSAQFLDELVKLSYKEAKKEFVLPGLGKLKVAQRNQRMGRNPATGESIVTAFDYLDVANKGAKMLLLAWCAGFEPKGLSQDQMKELEKFI